MAQVVIQPSYGSTDARKHWDRTLKAKITFSDGELQEALTDEQLTALMAMHPEGVARFWGATPNHDKRMSTLRPGDVIPSSGSRSSGVSARLGTASAMPR
ncbi:hypothetical protein GCM10010464_00460 [Pseudonocardia yunnanensis]|uniref:Uncharacterized protein n=1 Tax=Pseudonocardia yunnanensis TaxID=58107 RepID=A0ABW4FBD1_9PSEU